MVDPRTGYRGYRVTRLGDAAVIRDLRALDLPLAEIRAVLGRPRPGRDPPVADHDEYGHRWTVLRDPSGNEFCVG
jgi:DNA-binding transcriptional MerR regulator